jgi:hypothetical protein
VKTSRILLAAFVAALGFSTPTQAAAPARGLGDLIGDNHGQSGKQLRQRGFVRQSRDAAGSTLVEHWWNDDNDRCVELTLRRGRVSSVENASPFECGQQQTVTRRPGDWRRDRDDDGRGDREDDWRDEQVAREAYRRGYDDGLRRAGYDRDEVSDDYDEGYRAGRAARERQADSGRYEKDAYERGYEDGLRRTGYDRGDVSDDYEDGYRAGKAARERRYQGDDDTRSRRELEDLVGDRASSANDELRQRGFDHLYSGKVKGEPVSSWWNADTRQCIDVVLTEDGDRVEDIRHLGVDSCL